MDDLLRRGETEHRLEMHAWEMLRHADSPVVIVGPFGTVNSPVTVCVYQAAFQAAMWAQLAKFADCRRN